MAPELEKQLPHKNYPDKVGSSLIGKLFSIEFELQVYVKHASWNETGVGSFVSFPIRIH